jgi:hypothetical protein
VPPHPNRRHLTAFDCAVDGTRTDTETLRELSRREPRAGSSGLPYGGGWIRTTSSEGCLSDL